MQSSSFLRLLPRLYVAYIHSFAHPSSTRLRRQFLATMWLIQFNFLLFIVSKTPFPPRLYTTLLHFSYDRSNGFSPFFTNATSQNFQGGPISDIHSKVYTLQHHTKLYSKWRILLVYSLKLRQICWKTEYYYLMLLFLGNPGFNFTCTYLALFAIERKINIKCIIYGK
jgi:hypothetical protein